MFDSNDRFIPQKVEKYLLPEEIKSFNEIRIGSATSAEMRSLGMQLLHAGIQRKTLEDIEKQNNEARKKSDTTAKIATWAVGIQAFIMLIDLLKSFK